MTDIETKQQELEALGASMKPNHLLMARSLAEGNTQEQAYIDMGGTGKDPRKCASGLVKTNPDIIKYSNLAKEIAALASQEQLVATVDQKRRLLWKIAEHNAGYEQDGSEGDDEELTMVDPRATISAIAELNKMDGDLASIKVDQTSTNLNINAEIDEETTPQKAASIYQDMIKSV